MLLKWIVCSVNVAKRNDFSLAQTAWSSLSELPGFIGQLGGWQRLGQGEACILSLWQDHKHYQAFMNEQHDAIYKTNEQESTYSSSSVLLLEQLYDMNGSVARMVDCFPDANVMRVADCRVRPEREEHFLQAERGVWLPALSTVNGMLAGAFSRALDQKHRYCVTTLWTNAEAHDQYVHDRLPELQQRAAVSEDIEQLSAYTVSLHAEWLVLPKN